MDKGVTGSFHPVINGYEGAFNFPPRDEEPSGATQLRDALGRARGVLDAIRIEAMITGETFDFTVTEPPPNPTKRTDQDGTITMDKASYDTLVRIQERKLQELRSARGTDDNPKT